MRIVSLCPSNTELLGFMGLDSQLVGVDNYSDWPSPIGKLPRLGSDLDIDMEKVEQLKPDLVLASLSVPGMQKNVDGLVQRGLPHIVLNPKSLADIAGNMRRVGEALGVEIQAEACARKLLDRLEQYRELASGIADTDKPSLYWEWWPKPVYTPGGGNWLTEISDLAGAVNVYAEDERASVKTDWDDVLRRDPDYVLLAWVGVRQQLVKPDAVTKRPGAERMRAVAAGRVHVLEESLYCRPSPLLVAGLHKLAHLLHPDLYPAYDQQETERWLAQGE